MSDFEIEIKKDFINEALINLEEVESSFVELESASESDRSKILEKIFRLAHNLKGSSRVVGFNDIAELTHELESLVSKIQKGEIPLTSDIISILLKSNDRTIVMLNQLKEDLDSRFDNADIIQEIKNLLEPNEGVMTPQETPMTLNEKVESEIHEMGVELSESLIPQNNEPETHQSAETLESKNSEPDLIEHRKKEQEQEQEQVKAQPQEINYSSQKNESKFNAPIKEEKNNKEKESDKAKDDEIIRVSLSRINVLNDYVGELIVLQSVVQQQIHQENKNNLNSSIRLMSKLSKEIQELSMGLRMLPVKPLVQKLQRVIRDTAKSLEKEVNFHILGENMEIDKSVLDRLVDPLIHILRNAVDHGLEKPQDRVAVGKNRLGQVSISFFNQGNHLMVEVKDDGKGIDITELRKKAIEKRIIGENENLNEKQLLNLIFHPGFSTKSVATEISGRGVGMDVVKTNIEKAGGQVEVTTQVGKGTWFRLQIPLSLAVVDGIIVANSLYRYVFPLAQVKEAVNLKNQNTFVDKPGLNWCLELRGVVVPLFSLDDVLNIKSKSIQNEGTAIVISVDDQLIAIVVQEIVRVQQIVIKPFGNGIASKQGWLGTCILGDGQPTLILSPIDLLKNKITRSQKETFMPGAVS